LFGAAGGRGVSIAAVAASVGVTDAGVLYHFKTKQQLLYAVLEYLERTADEILESSQTTGIDLIREVGTWGAAMEAAQEIVSLQLVLSAEQIQGDGEERSYFTRRYGAAVARYAAAFAEAAASGDLRRDLDAHQEASALIAHLDGIRFQWFFLGGEVSMAVSVRAYIDNLLLRLRPET
jgi:AcrR family transcriptional regulator